MRIHPAIGVARVGNSAESFYFGPEVPGALPKAPTASRMQPARSRDRRRAFASTATTVDGRVVRELTEADANITWTVSVANTKAAWYQFGVALDLPIATAIPRRNESVQGDERAGLVIAPGPKSIGGTARAPVPLDGGTFLGAPVGLGELMVDGAGRLVVVPAFGVGVRARLGAAHHVLRQRRLGRRPLRRSGARHGALGDRDLDASPAWVVVTPPNYGPGVAAGLVSAYDSARTAWDVDTEAGRASGSAPTSCPCSRVSSTCSGSTRGFLRSNGWNTDGDFLAPKTLAVLASPKRSARSARQAVFAQLRDPSYATAQPDAVPQVYGDGTTLPARPRTSGSRSRRSSTAPSSGGRRATSSTIVTRCRRPHRLDDLPVRQRPAALDRAALEQCLGGAYHPGIELPWTLRVASMWDEPGRLRVRSDTVDPTDYGDVLTPAAALAAGGPLDGSSPGALTRWLGTPWQTDAASCRSGYEPSISPVLPTFWPARIPNHVLRAADYDDRGRHQAIDGRPARRVPRPRRLGALRGRAEPHVHPHQHDGRLVEARHGGGASRSRSATRSPTR